MRKIKINKDVRKHSIHRIWVIQEAIWMITLLISTGKNNSNFQFINLSWWLAVDCMSSIHENLSRGLAHNVIVYLLRIKRMPWNGCIIRMCRTEGIENVFYSRVGAHRWCSMFYIILGCAFFYFFLLSPNDAWAFPLSHKQIYSLGSRRLSIWNIFYSSKLFFKTF